MNLEFGENMKVDPSKYVKVMIESIDQYLLDNLNILRGRDLYEFYRTLFYKLKGFFGGSWGFEGVTEILVFRAFHHILGGNAEVIDITKDLKAFYYLERNIVLGAGLPLMIGNRKIWPDIIIYEPRRNDLAELGKLRSVIEIKAYPQGGLKAIKREVERLNSIHKHYCYSKLALIVYSINVKFKERSKIWKYLHRRLENEEGIPGYIDVLLLEECTNKVTEIFTPYISASNAN